MAEGGGPLTSTPQGEEPLKHNTEFKRSTAMESFIYWFDYICNDLGPGPAFLPMRYYINFHKGGMPFLILGMMIYYENFSLGNWVYLALHGSYGLFWIIKDYTFPDTSFERKVTLICFIVAWFVVISPYSYGAYLLASGVAPQDPSPERICIVVMMYCFGLVFMMGADGQKYFTLRVKKGLMNDGFMKWSRNPNYVGEMLIYSSFALTVQRYEPWYILAYMWTLIFLSRMLQKDYSLSKKSGWKEYEATSWMLPFKFGGSTAISVVIYGVSFYIVAFCLMNGGIEGAARKVFYTKKVIQ